MKIEAVRPLPVVNAAPAVTKTSGPSGAGVAMGLPILAPHIHVTQLFSPTPSVSAERVDSLNRSVRSILDSPNPPQTVIVVHAGPDAIGPFLHDTENHAMQIPGGVSDCREILSEKYSPTSEGSGRRVWERRS